MNYKYYNNGFHLRETGVKNYMIQHHLKCTTYHGIHEFLDEPLIRYSRDESCRMIQAKRDSVDNGDGTFTNTYFISKRDILSEYLSQCKKMNIPLSIIFIQSTYNDEVWNDELPIMTFLGYEIAEIPFDPCAIMDLYNNEAFAEDREKLNINGLFSVEEDAVMFMNQYNDELAKGLVGDGEVDLYVCKVYEVDESSLMKLIK